jgi:hypothetical protein
MLLKIVGPVHHGATLTFIFISNALQLLRKKYFSAFPRDFSEFIRVGPLCSTFYGRVRRNRKPSGIPVLAHDSAPA